MQNFKSLLRNLICCCDILFPPTCLVCDSPNQELLCHRCQLPPICTLSLRCQRCHEIIDKEGICRICSTLPQAFTQARYLWEYSNNARDFCVALKYKPSLKLIDHAAKIIAQELPILFKKTDWDYLLPMPCSTAGIKKRGFNHVELLTKILKAYTDLKYISLNKILIGTKTRRPQASLSSKDRMQGAKYRYKLSSKVSTRIKDKKILLIDDITTTGATIHAAITALNTAGVNHIDVITLCRSPSWYKFRSQFSLLNN